MKRWSHLLFVFVLTFQIASAFAQQSQVITEGGKLNFYSKTTSTALTAADLKMTIESSNGNVGIGTTAPTAKLDVQGEVKFGNSASTCDSSKEGQQRYNSTLKIMQYCDGTLWRDLSWRTLATSDTANFDTNCAYRVFTSSGNIWASVVTSTMLLMEVSTAAFRLYALPSSEKTYLDVVEDGNTVSTTVEDAQAVTKIQYRCD